MPRQVYEVEWNNEAFEKMKNLRMLKVDQYQIGCVSKAPKHLPNNLRVLFWDDYPSSSLPPDFHPKKLVILELRYSRFALEKPFKVKPLSLDEEVCLFIIIIITTIFF